MNLFAKKFAIRLNLSTVSTVDGSVRPRILKNTVCILWWSISFSGNFDAQGSPAEALLEEIAMEPIKILIADDHRVFRVVVRSFLDTLPAVRVVGEAVDGIDVIAKMEELDPDVVLMDIAMPRRNGLEATRIIKERWPRKIVLIATLSEDAAYRQRAREVCADAFILKSDLLLGLKDAFREGSSFMSVMRSALRDPAS
jgi:CheY-like chemotaxis protein